MKITKQQLRRIIKEEYQRLLVEECVAPINREPLKDILAHDDPVDVVHALHQTWEGGEHDGPAAENLVMPIDHAKAAGSEPATREPEILVIVAEDDLAD